MPKVVVGNTQRMAMYLARANDNAVVKFNMKVDAGHPANRARRAKEVRREPKRSKTREMARAWSGTSTRVPKQCTEAVYQSSQRENETVGREDRVRVSMHVR